MQPTIKGDAVRPTANEVCDGLDGTTSAPHETSSAKITSFCIAPTSSDEFIKNVRRRRQAVGAVQCAYLSYDFRVHLGEGFNYDTTVVVTQTAYTYTASRQVICSYQP